MKVFADPKNDDVVWVLNAPVLRSIDGGATFATVSATHGDNHALWINPDDPRYIINANDGGASVSLDGGASWSTQDNQPTAQFYHVTVDDDFPYKLYGGQQDNSSVVIRSRSDGNGIGVRDWWDGAGCESANIGVSREGAPLRVRRLLPGDHRRARPGDRGCRAPSCRGREMNLTERTDKTRYRFNWTAPIVVSQHDANVIYHGGNVLFRTRDRGTSWAPISPDLTRNDPARQGWGGGPITNEGAGGEVYATIVVIDESPHDANTMYVGTDDGLLQLTRDGGATWTNVTPAAWGDGLVNEIEVSPHDPATVYVAYRKDRVGDPAPYVYRSTDFGRTWTTLVSGLREGEPVRVVREDGERRGLLYAGTETGAYFSLDGGARWTAFGGPARRAGDRPRRAPRRPDRRHRRTRLLDPRRSLAAPAAGERRWRGAPVHLFKPRDATLAGGGSGGPPGRVGRNPAYGAVVHYRLAAAPDSGDTVSLEFLDARGTVLRRYTSATGDRQRQARTARGAQQVRVGPAPRGAHHARRRRALRRAAGRRRARDARRVRRAPHRGRRVAARRRSTCAPTRASNRWPPRCSPRVIRWPTCSSRASARCTTPCCVCATSRTQVHRHRGAHQGAPTWATASVSPVTRSWPRSTAWSRASPPRRGNGQDIINYANGLNGQFGFLLGQVEGHPGLTQPVRERFQEVEALWRSLRGELDVIESRDVAAFNRLLERAKLAGVITPSRPATFVP